MGRWTQYDEDDYRLPEGMKRVGYDADTGRYTFKDRSGTFWKGPEGAEFGEMTRVTSVVTSGNSGPQGCDETQSADFDSSSDLEALVAGAKKEEEYSDNEGEIHPFRTNRGNSTYNRGAYKTFLPFLLIVLVVLLLVARLVGSPLLLSAKADVCGNNTRPYKVKTGDSCWKISQSYGTSLEELRGANVGVDCAKLMPGQRLCVPVAVVD